jgi:hypothetical protein
MGISHVIPLTLEVELVIDTPSPKQGTQFYLRKVNGEMLGKPGNLTYEEYEFMRRHNGLDRNNY